MVLGIVTKRLRSSNHSKGEALELEPHDSKDIVLKGHFQECRDSDSDCGSSSGRGSGGSDFSDGERHEDSGRFSLEGESSSAHSPITPPRGFSDSVSSGIESVPHAEEEEEIEEVVDTFKKEVKKEEEKWHVFEDNSPTIEDRPVISHAPVDAPICSSCSRQEFSYFDPFCSSCWNLLKRPSSTPSHVFAVMRHWTAPVQQSMHVLVPLAMTLGCGINDRDALTDLTLLHYAVKSGSSGIGDPKKAQKIVYDLIQSGADVRQRCKWTHMTAIHYAAYFDAALVLQVFIQLPLGVEVNDRCREYDNGTPLHIAAANLSLSTAQILLHFGASIALHDDKGRRPLDCLPSAEQYEFIPDVQEIIAKFKEILSPSAVPRDSAFGTETSGTAGRAVLLAMGLKVGDRILVNGIRTGTLRYVGPTEFATGLWAGVELETPHGRHSGTINGVVYFKCAKNYGVFVSLNQLTKIPNVSGGHNTLGRSRKKGRAAPARSVNQRRALSLPPGRVNHGRVDISKVSSKVAQDIRDVTRKLIVGDKVYVDMSLGLGGSRVAIGVVRYTGSVQFASGYWIGIEMEEPRGSNDGSVAGIRYFNCRYNHGIFAAPSRVIKIGASSNTVDFADDMNDRVFRQSSYNSSKNNFKSNGPMSLSMIETGSSSSGYSANPWEEFEGSCQALGNLKRSTSLKNTFYPCNTSMTNLNKSFSARYIKSRQRQEEFDRIKEEMKKEPQWQEPPILPPPKNQKQEGNKQWLEIGHNVFYRNEVGVIRFIGKVHFECGTWLGLEMRKPVGRHDGAVKGKRYFSCRPKHGLMVKPSAVTVRGLKGSELISSDFDEDDDGEDFIYSKFS